MAKSNSYTVNGKVAPSDVDLAKKYHDTVERERFSSPVAFILTCVGFAVGLGNIWRFPALAYENGGGAFLIPYVCCSVLFGLPMLFLEFSLGQYMQCGPSSLFYKYVPIAQGIGWGMAGIAAQLVTYYYVIVGWVLVYIIEVLLGQSYKWTRCDNWWNSPYCQSTFNDEECASADSTRPLFFNGSCHPIEAKASLNPLNLTMLVPAEQYFENFLLQRSSGIDDFGGINWKVLVLMMFLWALCGLILWKGIKFMGRVSYFSTIVPYLIVAIMFVRGVTLEGAHIGLEYYILRPDFSRILDPQTWKNALTQMCYSLSVGFGGMQSMASYNPQQHNCFRDACIVVAADAFMSIFGGIAVFSVLGYLSHTTGKPMEEVVQSGTSLAFVAYPEAIARMPLPWLWAILFFLMLALLGTSTVVVNVQTILTCLCDFFPACRAKRTLVGFVVSFVLFCVSILMCTNSGIYWFTIFDNCTGGMTLVFVIWAEVVMVGYLYGINNFIDDLKTIFGEPRNKLTRIIGPTGWYFRINWLVISPVLLLCIIVVTAMRGPMTYGKGDRIYNFPAWSEAFGWALNCFILIFIPIFSAYNLFRMRRKYGSFMAAFRVHRSHPSYERIQKKHHRKNVVASSA